MRYAISYISTAEPTLAPEDIKNLLEKVTVYNNSHGITGVLLYSGSSFFQLVEGEKEKIMHLFSKIEKDPRHHSIIKFIEKPVSRLSCDGYMCDIVNGKGKQIDAKLEKYIHYLEVLDPMSRKAVQRIMETILM